MLASLRNGRATIARPARGPIAVQQRSIRSSSLPGLVAVNDVANRLKKADMRRRRRPSRSDNSNFPIEPRRINIVSEELCDDIMGYLGPSIERHRGCDLVDLNPGAGVWSRKLHSFLEPRKHIMMDLDAKLYSPFLGDLLAKDNVVLVPKSGLVWKDLLDMMQTQLSEQQELSKDDAAVRNDTLLVTANLTMAPKKTFKGFESLSTMIMYQFMSSIRTSTLFQKYGLVRMLVWISDEDTRRLLPRSINRRKRSSFEAEMSCEWIREVAGLDTEGESRLALRDKWINVESAYRTLERMQKQGLAMPPRRETRSYAASMAQPELMGQKLAGVRMPELARPFKQELEALERELASGEMASASTRLKYLRVRDRYLNKDMAQHFDMLQQHEAVSRLAAASPGEFADANAAWNERLENLPKNDVNEFNVLKDSYYFFRREPPGLFWDRRPYEPLAVTETEFFPNAASALLDIQPKAMRPIFRQHGPGTSRSGDMSDVMLRFWFDHTLLTIPKAMASLWPGFGDLVPHCPSIWDVARGGGTPMTGAGALQARAISEDQWAEILQAWMDWPFRPSYTKIIGRMVEEWDTEADEEELKSGAMGVGVF